MSRKKKKHISKGTGKRYQSSKPKPQSAPVRRTAPPPSRAEMALRERIIQFGLSHRFRRDFETAFEMYMGPEFMQKRGDQTILLLDEEKDEAEFLGFQEWFYFDYSLKSGKRIIDLFVEEVGPRLPEAQKNILEDWLATNRQHLLETQAVEPGIGETMQDLLSREVLKINDISLSYHLNRWSILLGRPLLTEGRWHFTGSGVPLNPLEKPQMLKAARELWAAYQEKHPQADLLDFYRDHSLDLRRAGKEIQEERGKPKALFTAEGHPIAPARAAFTLTGDPREVESALDEAEEFQFANVQEGGEFSDCLHYLWLLRGRSSVPEISEERAPSGGLRLLGSWTAGPGEPDFRTLGDLYLCWQDLTLSCMSRERLEAGKELLGQIMGNRIDHRQDHFKDPRELWDRLDQGEEEPDEDEWEEEGDVYGEVEMVEDEMRERLTAAGWIPPIKGESPPGRQPRHPEGGNYSWKE